MLRTTGDIRDEVLVRLNASTTISFYSDTILNDWLDQSHRWSAGFRKWPWTEGRVSTTLSLDSNDSMGYPEGWRADSIRICQVGGKRYQKLNYEDFLIFREDRSDDDERVFSDFGRRIYINPNGSSGTLATWGQYLPGAFDRTNYESETTIFSNNEEEGNEAMVQEMMAYAKLREHKPKETEYHHRRAIEILDKIWEAVGEEQFGYHSKNRGMWKRIDVLEGALEDELLKRDQFY